MGLENEKPSLLIISILLEDNTVDLCLSIFEGGVSLKQLELDV